MSQSLFILLTMIFMLFNMMNYFIYTPLISKSKNLTKIFTKSMNWKW